MMKYIERTIQEGIKETSKQSKEFNRDYEQVSNRIDQARLSMLERSKSRRLIKPQE